MQSRSRIQTTGSNNRHQLRDYSKSSNRSESPDLRKVFEREGGNLKRIGTADENLNILKK